MEMVDDCGAAKAAPEEEMKRLITSSLRCVPPSPASSCPAPIFVEMSTKLTTRHLKTSVHESFSAPLFDGSGAQARKRRRQEDLLERGKEEMR
jgi:hypothetical protein